MSKNPDGLFAQARQMMEEGELPPRVSNRLLWAAVSEVYVKQKEANGIKADIRWLKWAVRLIVTGLVGLAWRILL